MTCFTVRTQQRGPFLNMVLTVMRREEDCFESQTSEIMVNGVAVITGKVSANKSEKYVIQVIVGMKKTKAAENLTVLVTISFEGIKKQIICQEEMTEVQIKETVRDGDVYYNPHRVYLYSCLVNITVQVKTPSPTALSAVNQLYEDTEFTDFKLAATDGAVAVHKHMLLCHSDFFRTMLRGQWKETDEGTINMDGVTVETLQHLKEYMYLGTVPETGLEALLLVSRRCLMDDLVAGCIDKLITTVTLETFDGLVEFACDNNIPALVKGLVLSTPDNVVNGICRLQITSK